MNRLCAPRGLLLLLAQALLLACGDPPAGGGEADVPLLGDARVEGTEPDASTETPTTLDAGPPEEDADQRGPKLNSLIPNSGPLEGGTAIRLVGAGFLEGTVVHIGERECLGVTVVNENHIDCTTPTGFAPGPVSVTLRWSVGGVPHRVEEAFTYFVPVEVTAITPDRGPARGGLEVAISGSGFVESTEVRFGGTLARATFVDENQLTAVVPAGEPGPVEVLVRNEYGEARVAEGYTYFEDLLVLGLEPRWGYTDGGTEVAIRGAGLIDESTVKFGDATAEVLRSELDRTLLTVRTPRATPGLVAVSVDNINGAWRGPDAFLFVDEGETAFAAVGVVPSRVSVGGGDTFEVGGAGFDDTTTVSLDGEVVECTLTNPHILRCTAPAHAPGAVDVVVTRGDEERTLPGALTFFEKVDIYTVRPNRGAVAGGTLVEVRGEGFREDMTLTLDGEPLTIVEFTDSTVVWAVSPPGRPGLVAIAASTSEDEVLVPEAFEYFDPISRFGGVWGEPIEGAVNVTVLDAYTGEPVPTAFAMAMPADPAIPGETLVGPVDARGQVVLSGRGMSPPQNVTAGAPDYEITTVEDVAVENVTVYIVPHNAPSGNGGDPPPEIANARLTGTVSGMDKLEKPNPPYVLVAFVDTTHSSPYNRRVNLPAEPNGVLTDNGPFEVIVKPGEMAAIVTAGVVLGTDLDAYRNGALRYWEFHETMYPVAMGFQRFIAVSPGDDVEGLELVLDKPMDLDVPVRMANPPAGPPEEPYVYEAWPFLDFGAEGYWEIDSKGFGMTPDMTVTHMPDIRAWDIDIRFEWLIWGHVGAQGQIRLPYTITTEHTRDVTAGLDVGPIAGLPIIDRPTDAGPLGPERLIEWHWADGATGEPTTPPDATVLTIDSADGLPLWTYIVPGDVTRVELPRLPEDILPGGTVDDVMILTIVPFIAERGLDFSDFTYDDLGYWSRHSYSATGISFTP